MNLIGTATEKLGNNPVTWTLCAGYVVYAIAGAVAMVRRDITFVDYRNGLIGLATPLGLLGIGRGIAATKTTAARATTPRRAPAKKKPASRTR